jgi:hypothetical protein
LDPAARVEAVPHVGMFVIVGQQVPYMLGGESCKKRVKQYSENPN